MASPSSTGSLTHNVSDVNSEKHAEPTASTGGELTTVNIAYKRRRYDSCSSANIPKRSCLVEQTEEGAQPQEQTNSAVAARPQIPPRPTAAPTGDPRRHHTVRLRAQYGRYPQGRGNQHGRHQHRDFADGNNQHWQYAGSQHSSWAFPQQSGRSQEAANYYQQNEHQFYPSHYEQYAYQSQNSQHNLHNYYYNLQRQQAINTGSSGTATPTGQRASHNTQQRNEPHNTGVMIGGGVVSYTGAPTYNPDFRPRSRHVDQDDQ